uniref:CD248 molecule, endosialin a n=1 Tax=Kryptolebias marmoratus TaxID=37003 RepID=A0A3Q2ZZK4_KRYMA
MSLFKVRFLGFSSVLGQDLRDTDALCNADGCFVVYFERKIFLDSWRSCKAKGGNLATIKRKEDAGAIVTLFSTLDLRQSHTKVQVWIGLQRQPRQCSEKLPLRGFSWTTGDRDTDYTNWQREYSSSMCLLPRCVAMSYSTQEQSDNFKWLDSSCSVPVDGYLCHFAFKGMCSALWSKDAGNAVYTTPFNLVSTLLTHVPFGSVATILCPTDTNEDSSPILCTLRDGSVGWAREPPRCSDFSIPQDPCDQNNGGCEHFCSTIGGQVFCECDDGYHLGADGLTCELPDVCQEDPCEFECLRLPDSYRCACPDGFMLAPDEHGCLDVDECLQSPCEQLCKNAPGSFECQCWHGYLANDEGGCTDIDECMENPCEHTCRNTPGSYICVCDPGFTFDPQDPSRCQYVDNCQIAAICNQMCANYEGGFECYCKEGYELMSDQYTCQKIEGQDYSSIVTQPGFLWDVVQYGWNPSNTPWPTEEEQFTETQTVLDPGVISVTSVSQDEQFFDLVLNPQTQGGHLLESEITASTTISSSSTSDWNKDGEEEATTAVPILSTSTISKGAWNRRPELVTSTQSPENQEVTHAEMELSLGRDGVNLDPVQKDTEQKPSSNGLLVGLLVPICLFVVVMVALGIVYCTRCAVKPKNKNSSDCYHWISGAHDKQGASNPPTGVKTPV